MHYVQIGIDPDPQVVIADMSFKVKYGSIRPEGF